MRRPDLIKTLRVGHRTLLFDGRALRLAFLSSKESSPEPPRSQLQTEWSQLELPAGERGGSACSNPSPPKTSPGPSDEAPVLERLTLNVSNACPLACRYCYANQGCYYTGGMLMSREVALAAVNFIVRRFSRIEHVSFFGGEPTLNEKVIESTCLYWRFLLSRQEIDYQPTFGITTSGYRLSQSMLEVLQRFGFRVTVSVDGPRWIHDSLRITKKGANTFDAVARSIEALRKIGIEPEIECTYTQEHLRKGVDIVALMEFFDKTFDCRVLHCPLVISDSESRWYIPLEMAKKLYGAAVRRSAENCLRDGGTAISMAVRMISALRAARPIEDYCPAGKSTLTVNADGRVYSCFLLMTRPDYCLGSVMDDGAELGLSEELLTVLDGADKSRNPECQRCWARGLCFGCIGENLGRGGADLKWSASPGRSAHCDFRRHVAEALLSKVGELAVCDAPSLVSSQPIEGKDRHFNSS